MPVVLPIVTRITREEAFSLPGCETFSEFYYRISLRAKKTHTSRFKDYRVLNLLFLLGLFVRGPHWHTLVKTEISFDADLTIECRNRARRQPRTLITF